MPLHKTTLRDLIGQNKIDKKVREKVLNMLKPLAVDDCYSHGDIKDS